MANKKEVEETEPVFEAEMEAYLHGGKKKFRFDEKMEGKRGDPSNLYFDKTMFPDDVRKMLAKTHNIKVTIEVVDAE